MTVVLPQDWKPKSAMIELVKIYKEGKWHDIVYEEEE